MPKASSILAVLPRDALRQLLERHQLRATDARKTDSMVRALSRGLPAQKSAWLTTLPVATLKSAVSALALAPEGKGKAALVTALDEAPPAKKAKATPVKASAAAAKPAPKRAKAKPSDKAPAPAVAPAPKAKTPAKKAPAARAPAQKIEKKQAVSVAAGSDSDEPAKAPEPTAPSHMKSWSEAVALATKRGQSAATMIGQPMQEGGGQKVRCGKCRASLEVQDCQIHACDHSFIAKAGQKICAECMFERNNMSVDTFHERLIEDWQCPHCSSDVERP